MNKLNFKDLAKKQMAEDDILDMPQKTVPERLTALGDLFRQRGKEYGSGYLQMGHILNCIFPDGLVLSSIESHERYALWIQIFYKTIRYANNINKGGHSDSVNDISVYSQMLAEFDDLAVNGYAGKSQRELKLEQQVKDLKKKLSESRKKK